MAAATAGEVVARVLAITRYPVKSMGGETLESAPLGPLGVPDDRRHGLFDVRTGTVLSARREPRLLHASARVAGNAVEVTLPGGEVVRLDHADAGARLSRWLDREVDVVSSGAGAQPAVVEAVPPGDDPASAPAPLFDLMPGTLFDAAPVHLLTTASLRALRRDAPGEDADPRRFRPTLFLEAAGDEYLEEDWFGADLAVGVALLRVTKGTVRCAIPSRAQPGLEPAPRLIAALKRVRASVLGAYAVPVRPGVVAVGDLVHLSATRAAPSPA